MFRARAVVPERRLSDVRSMDGGSKRFPAAPAKGAAGKGGSVPVGELFRVAGRGIGHRVARHCDWHHKPAFFLNGCAKQGRQMIGGREPANEMGADIAANPHYPALSRALPPRAIPARLSCDQRPARRCFAVRTGTIRRRFGRPPFGGRPHLESPSSSLPCVCRSIRRPSDGLLSNSSLVRLNSWESLRSVTGVSIDVFVGPARSLPAGLATTLDVPAVRRLCRPMI